MALSNQTADTATLEVDPCIKTAPDNSNIFIEPLYLDERAGCTLTVKGANLLKQFIAAGILNESPSREQFCDAIRTETDQLDDAWRKARGIEDIRL